MPDPTQDRLSPEDAQALIHAQQHLFSINDPRAAKVYNYIVQNGYAKTGPQGELLPMDEMGPKPSWGQQALSMVTHPLNSLESAAQPVSRPAGASVPEMMDADAANVGAGAASVVRHPINTAANALATVGGLVTAPLEWAQGKPTIYRQTADAVRNANPQTGAFALGQAAATAGVGEGLPLAADAAEAFPWRPDMTAPAVGPMVRRAVAGDVNAPMPGTDLTPAARYQSMKGVGIQPNMAEATNSPLLKQVERLNQHSIMAAGTYSDVRAANLRALSDYTDDVLKGMSPLSDVEGGAAVQQALLNSHANLKAAATDAFRDLDSQAGNQSIPGAAGVKAMARQILDENGPYYKLHPEFEPRNAMAVVRDLAGAKGNAKPAPTVITGFGPAPPAADVAPPEVPTYSELHRVRSDLLDFNSTNNDLVKNQASGWVSRLAGAADNAITSGEGGLTPAQIQTFRDANAAWKFMKDNYDNPQSPLYSAVRTPSPSTLVNGIDKTPEGAGRLQAILGPKGIGPIQRGVAENLLRTTKEGGYNFKTFQGQWNKLDPEYRNALFTPEQQRQLADIGNAGTVLHEDLNPSGTAKLNQAQSEMGEGGIAIGAALTGHPLTAGLTGAYHVTQYALGKLMNSPTFVDWLMRDRGIPTPLRSPAGSAPAVPAASAAPTEMGVGPMPPPAPEAGPRDYTDAELGLIPGVPYGPAFRESRVRYKRWQDEAAKARGGQ